MSKNNRTRTPARRSGVAYHRELQEQELWRRKTAQFRSDEGHSPRKRKRKPAQEMSQMSADSEEPISDRPEEAPAKRTAKGTNADSGSDFAEKEHSELVNIVAVPSLSVLPPKDLPIDVEAEQEQHSPPAGNQGSPTAVCNEAQRLVTHLRRAITAFCESNTVGDIPADSNRLVKSVSISIVVTSRGEHKVVTDQGLSIKELIASLEGLKTLDKPGDKAKED